ncbi:heterokaryon incompatibility protein-domain-containing protein, partial [Suillus spraguei]
IIELDPSSHIGYQLIHAALRDLQRYDEATDAFTIILSKLDDLRQQYIHPSQAEDVIQRAVWTEFEYTPLRLLNTFTDLRTERITNVVATYFRCVLLSHRWEEAEAVLPNIQDKVVYELNGLGGIAKLQSFCKLARDAGYRWAWMDTCCIDKRSNTEVQESVNSMFVWYRHSALTIVYLCDVPPSSQPGALARKFVAPKALVTFRPGMTGAREKLQWASKRVTTLQEDVAYSLFGIFGITLPVIYGERKQRALGRLLQEIVAQSGDISVLDWIGQPSEFNSCLPADITSYTTPPRTLPPFSEDDIHTQVSSLRQSASTAVALKLYDQLEQLMAPRFANCRLHLPCISFRVMEVRRKSGPTKEYRIKADGLHDLFITTAESLTLLLVRPWDRDLLGVPDFAEQPDFTDDMESIENWSEARSPADHSQLYDLNRFPGGSPVEEEPVSRALRLMVRLGQPFDAFSLAQQRVREYKRIASDYNIVAQVKDITSVDDMVIRTVEIL